MSFILKTMVCLSTQFGHPGDGHGGRSPTVLTGKPVTDKDIGIAHRTWPVGSVVLVTNLRTKQSMLAVVIDRGPWGKIDSKGKWFNPRERIKVKGKKRGPFKDLHRKGVYRGCADLTPRLAKLIGHNRKERVRLTLL